MSRSFVIAGVWFLAIAGLGLNPLFAQSHGTHVNTPSAISHPESSEHASTGATKTTDHDSPHLTFIQRIDANPQLVARLTPLLPSGTTLDQAAAGFRNQGQFIAALHASQNLGIPFTQLKSEMTGTDHDSLGKAIHDLKPTLDAKAAAKTAEQEARADVKTTRPASVASNTADTDDKK
jgi:hypothetical protein